MFSTHRVEYVHHRLPSLAYLHSFTLMPIAFDGIFPIRVDELTNGLSLTFIASPPLDG